MDILESSKSVVQHGSRTSVFIVINRIKHLLIFLGDKLPNGASVVDTSHILRRINDSKWEQFSSSSQNDG